MDQNLNRHLTKKRHRWKVSIRKDSQLSMSAEKCKLKQQWYTTSAAAKSLQSCSTLCDPIDGSPPGSPVPGILQARTLEWVAISFSKKYSNERKLDELDFIKV